MARENYSYKKYQRELASKKKAEAKKQKKLDKKKAEETPAEPGISENTPNLPAG